MRPSTSTTSHTNSMATSPSQMRSDDVLIAVRYEETVAQKKPIAVTVAPRRQPPTEPHPAFRGNLEEQDESKRDSGLAPTTSSKAREGSVTTLESVLGVSTNFNTPSPHTTTTSLSQIPPPESIDTSMANDHNASAPMSPRSKPGSAKGSAPSSPLEKSPRASIEDAFAITTPIPTESLLEDDFLNQLSFSKRGSVMLGGKKAINGRERVTAGRRAPSVSLIISPSPKVLSEEVQMESQKVRSLYESGITYDWQDGKPAASSQANVDIASGDEKTAGGDGLLAPEKEPYLRSDTACSVRTEYELAGGIEDWEDINGSEVDRYGFISSRGKRLRPGTPEPKPPQRVSTALQLASEAPRRRRTFGRSASTSASFRYKKGFARRSSARSFTTQNTQGSRRSSRSGIRAAANRLPGNSDRRWRDEAGDMLTLPPGLADIAEDEEGGKAADLLKKKEWERSEKWRKMAKVVKSGKDGQGMEFEFDTKSAKLIERTWKGIPDRWRAAAWFSFLNTSAKKRKDSPTIQQLTDAFHKLQEQSCADDMQIDIDVPRTINSHIMFRRRYRGGQRLLFRVLHALALFFPDTGYVQGMASLAATFLCYYDEEKTFIMLSRMWTLRGLDKLYEAGFPGLMASLDEFQKQWLNGSEVSKKLDELGIEPTAYGTRWYLTLFNYSIPFPAQVRVWDVFILLGDSDPTVEPTAERPFAGGLDVLHATSAALIDGTREILLDSDFENAMKVLTSWIPVKDEELLMKVTKAEWKLHRGKKKN